MDAQGGDHLTGLAVDRYHGTVIRGGDTGSEQARLVGVQLRLVLGRERGPLVISLPLAVKYRYWQSILWMPTWFAFAFLRRLSTLEATISLPARPFPALYAARSAAPVRDGGAPAVADAVRR